MRLAHATRSMLMLPTTNNFLSTIVSSGVRGFAVRWERISHRISAGYGGCRKVKRVEARAGIEPAIKGFADPPLTTWVPRHSEVTALFEFWAVHLLLEVTLGRT
jgi:hypothetical protein